MTAELIEPTDDEVRTAVRRALDRCGYTYDELAEQARTGAFTDMTSRYAWIAVCDLRKYVS